MKTKKNELNIDIIGGQGSLTIEEEKALSTFFKKQKLSSKKPPLKGKGKNLKKQKVTA